MQSAARQNSHSRRHSTYSSDPKHLLEDLFVLDEMLVEVSMQLYNVNRRERSRMRRQNRRLHAAVRRQLPQMIKHYRKAQSR